MVFELKLFISSNVSNVSDACDVWIESHTNLTNVECWKYVEREMAMRGMARFYIESFDWKNGLLGFCSGGEDDLPAPMYRHVWERRYKSPADLFNYMKQSGRLLSTEQ